MMRQVLYAMMPGILVLIWLFGWGVLFNIIIASMAAITAEAALLTIRKQPVKLYLSDTSALVTAWLLAIALPPLSPWWLVTLGTVFAIVIAKHLYGGLGYNPFNPAMVGYVVLLVSFPLEISLWPAPEHNLGFMDTARLVFWEQLPDGMTMDALTGATPLDTVKTHLSQGKSLAEIASSPAFGIIAGQDWEWVSLAFLIGGLWLVYNRIAAWQIPAAMLASLALLSGFFYATDTQSHASPWFHVFSFSAVYGAFFIATDPVSASTTPRGRLLYGAGIGTLVYIIRSFGTYPDGVAFAVLLMNITAPTIDYYTPPRVFGTRRG
jgi:electron transport complex protein RnfD